MEALASISGLATGIDFRGLVDEIIAAESQRLDFLRIGISRAESRTSAWEEVRALLDSLRTAGSGLRDGSAINVFQTTVLGATPGLIEASAGVEAQPGSHTVRVLERAGRETLGSALQSSRSTALGLSGSFVVGGRTVDVQTTDTLQDVAAAVNATNTGDAASGVTASVVGAGSSFRLVISAAETGSAGVDVRDVGGVLADLGFLDGTTTLKYRTSGGFRGDGFSAATSAVGGLLGFTGPSPAGTVTFGSGAGAFGVALDLGTMSLEGVRDAINQAAGAAGSSLAASIESVDGVAGPEFRLSIDGTAAAVDDGGVLQALGLVEGGRSAVRQTVRGDVLSSDAGGTPATAGTLLTDLFNGGITGGMGAGDSILFQGRRHDGTSFSFTHTVAAGDTLQTVIDRLEGAEGFQGSASVTVTSDGRLQAEATEGGASLLGLDVFAGNEGGGTIDFGVFEITAEGRARELVRGTDALVEVDGFLTSSATNEINGVVPGLTINVRGVDPGQELEVVVERDVEAATESVRSLVDAYNALTTFVDTGVGVIGDSRPALAGDGVLRGIRNQVRQALETVLGGGGAGAVSRLADVGIEIQRSGSYTFDSERFQDALRTDAARVTQLLGGSSVSSSSALIVTATGPATTPGTYAVEVTQAATAASVTSSGFGGVYVDDGVADTLSISDSVSGGVYDIALTDGSTLQEIVDAARTELARSEVRELTSARTLFSDTGAATAATEATTLDSLYHGAGTSSGFVAGTELTFSGTARDGSAVFGSFQVTDPSTQTLGDVLDGLRATVGTQAEVTLEAGQIVVRDLASGASELSVNVGADVAGNEAPFGALAVTAAGRSSSSIVAEAVDGELRLRRSQAGSAQDFTVSLQAGGADGTGGFGLAGGTFSGTDVVGTIGGEEATGVGDRLTADPGTEADGLTVRVVTGEVGVLGSVTHAPGVGLNLEGVLSRVLGSGDGSIDTLLSRIESSGDRLEDRLFEGERRLDRRRERLLAQFSALESAIAQAQAQAERITAQLGSLPGSDR